MFKEGDPCIFFKKYLHLMESIQRLDCGRGGGCVWVGGYRKDILSITKRMMKGPIAFKPEGLLNIQ